MVIRSVNSLLLDTQIILWILADDPKLNSSIRHLIMESDDVYVSAASTLEITIKSMLGKLVLPANFDVHLAASGLKTLDITPEHTTGLRKFPELRRHDPFDRLLLAQADHENLQFVTTDSILIQNKYSFVTAA